jgi:hypothetical protein
LSESDDRRTLVAIKLRATRTLREAWVLGVIIIAFLALLAGIGACQVLVCTQTRSDLSVGQCVARLKGGIL